jgi:hypothetical protein
MIDGRRFAHLHSVQQGFGEDAHIDPVGLGLLGLL